MIADSSTRQIQQHVSMVSLFVSIAAIVMMVTTGSWRDDGWWCSAGSSVRGRSGTSFCSFPFLLAAEALSCSSSVISGGTVVANTATNAVDGCSISCSELQMETFAAGFVSASITNSSVPLPFGTLRYMHVLGHGTVAAASLRTAITVNIINNTFRDVGLRIYGAFPPGSAIRYENNTATIATGAVMIKTGFLYHVMLDTLQLIGGGGGGSLVSVQRNTLVTIAPNIGVAQFPFTYGVSGAVKIADGNTVLIERNQQTMAVTTYAYMYGFEFSDCTLELSGAGTKWSFAFNTLTFGSAAIGAAGYTQASFVVFTRAPLIAFSAGAAFQMIGNVMDLRQSVGPSATYIGMLAVVADAQLASGAVMTVADNKLFLGSSAVPSSDRMLVLFSATLLVSGSGTALGIAGNTLDAQAVVSYVPLSMLSFGVLSISVGATVDVAMNTVRLNAGRVDGGGIVFSASTGGNVLHLLTGGALRIHHNIITTIEVIPLLTLKNTTAMLLSRLLPLLRLRFDADGSSGATIAGCPNTFNEHTVDINKAPVLFAANALNVPSLSALRLVCNVSKTSSASSSATISGSDVSPTVSLSITPASSSTSTPTFNTATLSPTLSATITVTPSAIITRKSQAATLSPPQPATITAHAQTGLAGAVTPSLAMVPAHNTATMTPAAAAGGLPTTIAPTSTSSTSTNTSSTSTDTSPSTMKTSSTSGTPMATSTSTTAIPPVGTTSPSSLLTTSTSGSGSGSGGSTTTNGPLSAGPATTSTGPPSPAATSTAPANQTVSCPLTSDYHMTLVLQPQNAAGSSSPAQPSVPVVAQAELPAAVLRPGQTFLVSTGIIGVVSCAVQAEGAQLMCEATVPVAVLRTVDGPLASRSMTFIVPPTELIPACAALALTVLVALPLAPPPEASATAVVFILAATVGSQLAVPADPTAVVSMAALVALLGPCALPRERDAARYARYLLSPLIDFGPVTIAFAHAAGTLAAFGVQGLAVVAYARVWRRPPTPSTSTTTAAYGGRVYEAAVALRFPSVAYAAAAVLYPGLAFGAAGIVNRASTTPQQHQQGHDWTATEVGVLVLAAAVLIAVPAVAAVVFLRLFRDLKLEDVACSPTGSGARRVPWVMPRPSVWTPQDAARCVALVRGVGIDRHCVAVPVGSALYTILVMAVIAAPTAGPLSTACRSQLLTASAATCAGIVLVAWRRPFRTHLSTCLTLATTTAAAALFTVQATSRDTGRPVVGLALAVAVLSLLKSLYTVVLVWADARRGNTAALSAMNHDRENNSNEENVYTIGIN